MENNEVLENQWDNDSSQSMNEKRGSFLLVLCILSWISIGSSLIYTLISYFNGTEQLEKQLAETSDVFEQETGSEMINNMLSGAEEILYKTIENFNAIQLSTIVGLLIGALGVYLMFQLKKSGFFLYVLYSVIIPFISLYFIGSSAIIVIGIASTGLISVVFLILYAVNLKRMSA